MNNPKIKIDFTAEDLQDLMNGETFDWTYITDTGVSIDLHLYNSEDTCEQYGCENEPADGETYCDEHQNEED